MNWKKFLKAGICGAATLAAVATGGFNIASAAAPAQQLPQLDYCKNDCKEPQ